MTGQVYVGDRVYFRRALETRDFAIGEYQIGRITGKATLNFGYPVLERAMFRAVFSPRSIWPGSTNWLGKRDCRREQCSP